jgi:hypothetical protein
MASNRLGGALELALLGNSLVRLGCAFDAILLLVALGGEHAHDLIDAAGVTAAEQASDDVNIVADAKLVSQVNLLNQTQSFSAPQQQRMNRSS